MEAYTGFAEVYDIFMDNIPYKDWAGYLISLLNKYGVNGGIIAELGCGTGNITKELSEQYDMIGIDNSEEMLSIAMKKQESPKTGTAAKNILYLLQDMREFELYGTVSAVVSICDSINYILEEEELKKVFSLVNNYLEPSGVFIFDINTIYKYETILSDNTIAENRQDCGFIWDNYYDKEDGINEYDLTIYVKADEQKPDLPPVFYRYQETHYQRAYSLYTIQKLLEQAGMEYVTAYDAFTFDEPKKDSERIYIVAREKYQKDKKYQQES